MAIKDVINEIMQDVADVVSKNFTYTATQNVPTRDDAALSYEFGKDKAGKTINTCVLYVDIRNSVALTQKHNTQTMGRIYTAFSKAVAKVAKHHNGHVRNIIGDRVMIVFPVENCFVNAIECAISINHIAKHIINKQFKDVDFKCGIGIDYGELKIIKVGIQRRGEEHGENKGLVWTGYPANIASRLTDYANKEFEKVYYDVNWYPINYSAFFPIISPIGSQPQNVRQPTYINSAKHKKMTPQEFASQFRHHADGTIYLLGGKLISFSEKTEKYSYPAILMTEDVYKGYKQAKPDSNTIKEKYLNEQDHDIPNVKKKVWGGDIHWKID